MPRMRSSTDSSSKSHWMASLGSFSIPSSPSLKYTLSYYNYSKNIRNIIQCLTPHERGNGSKGLSYEWQQLTRTNLPVLLEPVSWREQEYSNWHSGYSLTSNSCWRLTIEEVNARLLRSVRACSKNCCNSAMAMHKNSTKSGTSFNITSRHNTFFAVFNTFSLEHSTPPYWICGIPNGMCFPWIWKWGLNRNKHVRCTKLQILKMGIEYSRGCWKMCWLFPKWLNWMEEIATYFSVFSYHMP